MGHRNYTMTAILAAFALAGCSSSSEPLAYNGPAWNTQPHSNNPAAPPSDRTGVPDDRTNPSDNVTPDVDPELDVPDPGACKHDGQCMSYANAPALCAGGQCTYECYGDFLNCDDDTSNGCESCGACGQICSNGSACSAGDCWPQLGWGAGVGGADNDFGMDLALDAAGNVYVTGSVVGDADLGTGPTSAGGQDDIFVSSYGPQGLLRWTHRWGAPGLDRGHGLATDDAGKLYVTGTFDGAIDFDGKPLSAQDPDAFLLSVGAGGSVEWAKSFPSMGADAGGDVVVFDGGKLAVVGWFEGALSVGGEVLTSQMRDMFVAAMNNDGSHIWSMRLGGRVTTPGAELQPMPRATCTSPVRSSPRCRSVARPSPRPPASPTPTWSSASTPTASCVGPVHWAGSTPCRGAGSRWRRRPRAWCM